MDRTKELQEERCAPGGARMGSVLLMKGNRENSTKGARCPAWRQSWLGCLAKDSSQLKETNNNNGGGEILASNNLGAKRTHHFLKITKLRTNSKASESRKLGTETLRPKQAAAPRATLGERQSSIIRSGQKIYDRPKRLRESPKRGIKNR